MRGKKADLWDVLIPIMILVALLVLFLLFSGVATRTISNVWDFIKNLFRFG